MLVFQYSQALQLSLKLKNIVWDKARYGKNICVDNKKTCLLLFLAIDVYWLN